MSDILALQLIFMVCATVAFGSSLRFLLRYLELRQQRRLPNIVDSLAERLEHIEQTVDATAIEVERISEANRFMSKLLAERNGPLTPASRPERVITPH